MVSFPGVGGGRRRGPISLGTWSGDAALLRHGRPGLRSALGGRLGREVAEAAGATGGRPGFFQARGQGAARWTGGGSPPRMTRANPAGRLAGSCPGGRANSRGGVALGPGPRTFHDAWPQSFGGPGVEGWLTFGDDAGQEHLDRGWCPGRHWRPWSPPAAGEAGPRRCTNSADLDAFCRRKSESQDGQRDRGRSALPRPGPSAGGGSRRRDSEAWPICAAAVSGRSESRSPWRRNNGATGASSETGFGDHVQGAGVVQGRPGCLETRWPGSGRTQAASGWVRYECQRSRHHHSDCRCCLVVLRNGSSDRGWTAPLVCSRPQRPGCVSGDVRGRRRRPHAANCAQVVVGPGAAAWKVAAQVRSLGLGGPRTSRPRRPFWETRERETRRARAGWAVAGVPRQPSIGVPGRRRWTGTAADVLRG